MLTENQAIEWNINYLKELRRRLHKDTSREDRQEIDSMIQYWIKKRRKLGQPRTPELPPNADVLVRKAKASS